MSATADRAGPLSAQAGVAGRRALAPAELAWVALVPCALAMLAVVALLGPPLAHVLFKPGSDALWPPGWWEARGRPEPVKHARYLLAVLAPLVLAGVVLLGARRGPRLRLRPRTVRAVTLACHALLLALVVLAVLGQRDVILIGRQQLPKSPFFDDRTLLVAAALVTAALLGLRRTGVAERIAALVRETTTRRVVCLALATAFAVLWLLETVRTDGLVEDQGQLNWTLNDAFAVLDGRTPLVDYHLLYGKLVPYPAALALATFGTTALTYTLLLGILSVLALVAVYAVLRRVAGGSLPALALFAPFVALSGTKQTMIMAGMWPMRYGGAYLLAWMTARQVEREQPRRVWLLFLVGGLVAVNSVEFGLGALGASLAALLCARPPRSLRELARPLGAAAAGVLAAVALVCGFTLLRAGALPDPDQLMEWPRIFTALGWFALPVPGASLHLALYATFAAAVVVAAVRVARAADDALLTSMLMWSGLFGLVAGSYYVGRAEDLKLAAMFSAWAFALVLLTALCMRALAARGWRRPALPELLVLFGFALAVCAIPATPWLGTEVERLTRSTPPLQYRPAAERFVREHTQRGEKVVILLPEGHRIAYDLGLDNVSPFALSNAIVTVSQMRTLIDAAQREAVTEIFIPDSATEVAGEGNSDTHQLQLLESLGYAVASSAPPGFLELRRGS